MEGRETYLLDRSSPKVVEEYVLYGRVWTQIPIVFNGADVVEDETAVETIVVADYAGRYQDNA